MSLSSSAGDGQAADDSKRSAEVVNMPVAPRRHLQLALQDVPGGEANDASIKEGSVGVPLADSRLSDEAPGKMPIVMALEYIAGHWFGRKPVIMDVEHAGGPLAPETAIAFAAELGLELVSRQKKLERIRASDFPCLIIDRDGNCRVLIRRINHWAFLCRTAESDCPVDRKHLETTYSGTVFFVRPIESFVERASHGEVDADAMHSDDRPIESVVGYLISTMLTKRPAALVQLAVAAFASNALLIMVPIFSMAVFDRVIPHLAYETLWALTIGIMIALSADLALRHVKVRLIDSVAADISHVVQVRFFRRMVYGRMKGLPRKGGALAQTVRDLEGYSQLIPMCFISLAVDLPFVAITSIILYDVAGSVALVPFIGGLITCFVFALAHINGRARLAPYLGLMATQSNSVIETIEGLETVKTTTAETALLNKWERLADATSFGSHMSRLSLLLAQQWLMSISQVMTVATLVLGVYEISQNAMTVGALSASTMLVGRLIGPISQFIVQAQRIAQAKKTLEPIRHVLNAPIERAGDGGFAVNRKVSAHIDVLNVSHSYPDAHAPSLSGITLAIRPGERIGIIGRVGSGKSTLLRLLVRLLDPTEGAIRLDGSDIRQFSPREIRRQFAYMKQETSLFDDTLRANLFFGLDHADPTLADEALTISGVGAFAGRSPEGFGLRVGPRGERLSGGEKQAVGLARAMIGNPTLLLLDEPTASMDNTTERQIITGLSQWLKGRTLIVATHRAAMLDLVDRVILMHEGKIIADGPKDQVLKKLQTG